MAILIDSTSPVTGETITNSYVNISDIKTKKLKDGTFELTAMISYYISETSRNSNGHPFRRDRRITTYDESSLDNAYVQAYNYLKTLDAFPGATDA